MFGWFSSWRSDISRMAVDGTPSHSLNMCECMCVRVTEWRCANFNSRIQSDLLQCHSLARWSHFGFVDNSICAFPNLFQSLKRVHPIFQSSCHGPCDPVHIQQSHTHTLHTYPCITSQLISLALRHCLHFFYLFLLLTPWLTKPMNCSLNPSTNP